VSSLKEFFFSFSSFFHKTMFFPQFFPAIEAFVSSGSFLDVDRAPFFVREGAFAPPMPSLTLFGDPAGPFYSVRVLFDAFNVSPFPVFL